MKIAVIVFPGSNCDQDLLNAVNDLGGVAEFVDYRATSLEGYAAVMIPGGFSYGDYLRAGAIARFAPVMTEVVKLAQAGAPVFGTCNGFQILTEVGLLPGALKRNVSQQFVCKTVPMEVVNNQTPFTSNYQAHERIDLPIAHADGCYYADPATLAQLEANGQVAFRYAAENPNGSLNNIAGVTNAAGNVLGMMPHPERAIEALLGNTAGQRLFTSLFAALTSH